MSLTLLALWLWSAPRFVDVTATSGVTFHHDHGGDGRRFLPETMGAGGCVLDFDGDGRQDLFFVQSGALDEKAAAPDLHRLFRNLGGGRFADVTLGSGLEKPVTPGYGQGATCADFEGDGDVDIYVTRLGPNLLFRNRGEGRFAEVGATLGLADPAWSSSATFFDADQDGDLDLYVVNYLDWTLEKHRDCRHQRLGIALYCHPDAYPHAVDRFFRQEADGRFREMAAELGLVDGDGKGLGVVAADCNDDGRSDLYVANDSTPNFLFENRGGRFLEIGLEAGVALNGEGRTEAGMGVEAADLDGDLKLDLFVTNLSLEANALYLGAAQGFRYATRHSGLYAASLPMLGFGTHAADLDNDGDRDLIVVNGDVLDNIELINDGLRHAQPGQVFWNDGRARFTAATAAEVGSFGQPRVGRGSMVVDLDDDGRLDLVVSYNNNSARLFRNLGRAGHFIGFDLRGSGKNTHALGAKVTITAGDRRQIAEVKNASSYLTSSDPRLHFGLGAAAKVDQVTIRWPSGRVQELRDLAVDRYHVVVESAE